MVAVKLWLCDNYYGIIAFGNQNTSAVMHVNNLARFILHNLNTLTTLRTSVGESLQMHFKRSRTDASGHYQHAG